MSNDRKLPFDCVVLSEPEVVKNRFSGEAVTLQPDAVAVYDTIIGAEMVGDFRLMRKGLDWFRKYYPKEYMTLLD